MGLGAVVGLARRRPAAAPVAPMASPLHTFGLLRVGDLLARDTECSPAERAAFAELAPRPGRPSSFAVTWRTGASPGSIPPYRVPRLRPTTCASSPPMAGSQYLRGRTPWPPRTASGCASKATTGSEGRGPSSSSPSASSRPRRSHSAWLHRPDEHPRTSVRQVGPPRTAGESSGRLARRPGAS